MKLFPVPLLQSFFNKIQFGFLPTGFGGCSNAVTYARLDILRHLSTISGHVRCLQIDMEKAFDRASPSIILSSLPNHVSSCLWISSFVRSYLSDRWQRVVSSFNSSSLWMPVTSDVSQGLVLGSISFAINLDKFHLERQVKDMLMILLFSTTLVPATGIICKLTLTRLLSGCLPSS